MKYCKTFSPELLLDRPGEKVIKLVKLSGIPPDVEFCLIIHDDFRVEAYRSKMKVFIRDLVHGFSVTIAKYSQIDAVIDRLRITPLDLRSELRSAGRKFLSICVDFDEDEDDSWERGYRTCKTFFECIGCVGEGSDVRYTISETFTKYAGSYLFKYF